MRAPVSNVVQNPDGKLIIEIVAAFKLEDCLIAASPHNLQAYPFSHNSAPQPWKLGLILVQDPFRQ